MDYNWQNALSGMSTGGSIGGGIGGPIGAGVGIGLGALGGFVGNQQGQGGNATGGNATGGFWTGSPGGFQQANQYAPWQQDYFKDYAKMGMDRLKKSYGQDQYAGFDPIAQQARTQFNQQTVPSLAQRFASMGDNAISSPSFTSELGQAGAGLEGNLAALKSQYGMANRQQTMNEQNQLMQLMNMGMSPMHQNFPVEGKEGFLNEATRQVAPYIGHLGMQALSGYMGAPEGQGWQGAKQGMTSYLQGKPINTSTQATALPDYYKQFSSGLGQLTNRKLNTGI
jgi:hypothetical protein